MGRHNPFEENDRDPGRGMGTLDVPYNPDMVFDFDYDYAHPRRSGSLPNQAALALPVGATSCTPIEPGVRVVIEDKAPQQVSFNAWAGEYENDESTGDQEDAGLSTRFPGNASPMSYSSIAGKGDSPPIEFDLDTSAYHRIMLKPTDHPGDRSRNLNERKVHHDSLPQPPRATPIPEDFSFEAKHSGPLLLEGDIMSSDPLGGEKRVGSVDICSPDDLGLQSRVSMKNGKPFKCKFPHCLTTGFRTLGSKQRHEREMHSLELKCLICDFSAKRLYQISNHTEAAHPEQIATSDKQPQNVHSLIPVHSLENAQGPSGKSTCKFFKYNKCAAGELCLFSHDLAGTGDRSYCKYFAKGNCKFGMKCANAHIIPDDRQIKIPWGAPLNTSYAHQSDSGQGSADPYHDQDLDLIQSLLGADIVPSNDEEKWFDISEHQNPETPDVLSFFGGRKQGPLSAVYDINVHDVARAREDTEESTKDSLAMGIAAEATHDRLEKLAGLNDTGDLGYSALARRFSGRYQTPVSPSSDDIEAQAGSVPWASNRSSMVMGTHEALSKALCAVQEDLDSPSQAPTPPSHQISPSSLLKRHHSLPHQQARSIESLAGAGDVIDGNDAAHAIEEHERFHEVQTELENVMETTHGQLGRKSTWEGELGEHQPHDMQPDTGGQPNSGYALQYYQMHLMWLEEQNKKRIARQKQITMPKDGSDRQPAVLLPSKQQSGGSQAPWPEADETLRLAVSFYDQFTTSENTETTSTSQSTALATSEQENAHNQNGTEGLDYNNPGSKPSLSQVRQRRSSNSSDISQTSSLASIGDSLFSLASASSMSSILSTHGAGDRLITLLREDPVLQPLYRDALIRVAVERLERNLRRLLKRFAVDLRKEAEGPQQRGAAHFVRSRARNSAHIICSSLKCDAPKPIPKSFPTMNISSEAVEDVSDNSSDSDNQEDELADLRELEAFIVTSMAFETLRLNLRLFVYPEESAVSVPELSVGTGTTDCPSLGPPMMAEELGGTSESYSAESESGCFRTTLALYKYFVILWLFLYLFIYFVILWLLVYLPWQHRVFHYDLDLEPGTLVHYARSSRFARWDSNPDICSINGVYIGYCVGWAFAVILGIISAMPLWILKRFISLKSRTTKISRGIIDITNDQSKNSSDDLSHKDNACTKSLKPSRWRFTTERKYLEERIFTTLPTVSRLWQNFGEYGKRHSLPVMLYELMRWEPRIPKGKTRIRWKCKCGQSLYDDFTELKQGAARRLEGRLNRRDDGSNRSIRSRLSFKSFSTTVSSSMDSLKKAFGWKESELPKHKLQMGSNELPNNPPAPPAPPTEPLFLLLCHSEGVYAKKLLQLSICDLKSDKKLFAVLRSNYKQMRARWWSFLSFKTLVGIKFVKFEMYKSSLVDICEKNAIPPPERVGHEYRYKPTPPEMIPPVGENHLMHLFQHPGHAEDEPVCLERFPKKLRERLAVCGGQLTGFGWGLSLEEGWDCKKTSAVGFVIFVMGSALWGILWTVFEKSIQDAFAVAAYMVSFAVVTVGFMQAMLGGLS